MEGSDKRFVIPVYQRNYDWKIENCKQRYDDLVKIRYVTKRFDKARFSMRFQLFFQRWF